MIINLYDVVNKYRDANFNRVNTSQLTNFSFVSNTQSHVEFNQESYKLNQIYVFGDSLCDVGNSFDVTEKALGEGIPPTPPYYSGRFSNGRLWVEHLAQLIGISQDRCKNFAFGGANTGNTNTLVPNNSIGLLGLQQQIEKYKAENDQTDAQPLYIIWAGANDYLNGGITNHTIPVQNLTNAVKSLANAGAKNIMILNLPDLGILPIIRSNTQQSTFLSNLTLLHNSALATSLEILKPSLGHSVKLITLDAYLLFNQVFKNPKKFGFTNAQDSALNQYVNSQGYNEVFFFWDDIHPTASAHVMLAQSAIKRLSAIRELSLIK